MNVDSAAQVVHALAANHTPRLNTPGWDSWPEIAARLLRDGYRWPALMELADMEAMPNQDVVLEAVGRLARQTRSDVGPAMNIWDIAVGLVAHVWKQGATDALGAVCRLNWLWDAVPKSDRDQSSRPDGVTVIGQGVVCWASSAHVDVTAEAERIMARALQLIPPVSFSVGVCQVIFDDIY